MNPKPLDFKNPFRPGAGHMPPYLAGREKENKEFQNLLKQTTIFSNLILTGLRGVGKTVLSETFKPIAIKENWLWVGTDMSESASISESNIAIRLLTDLSVITSSIVTVEEKEVPGYGNKKTEVKRTLNFNVLKEYYDHTPGLDADKLKAVLEMVWHYLSYFNKRGVIFAYDEAQNLSDHASKNQYPLSLLLDVFQSIQKKEIPFMLLLTGLPTLFPKLVQSRTYSERMFQIVFLDKLGHDDSKDAILKPIQVEGCPVVFKEDSVNKIIELSGGYPYFIQFICRETYDVFIQKVGAGKEVTVPIDEIIQKLDSNFFAGRWARTTDRQRELMLVAAMLENSDKEFTVQQLVRQSKEVLNNPFSSSNASQVLIALGEMGLIYKNRYGKYSFAVPLMNKFILRQSEQK